MKIHLMPFSFVCLVSFVYSETVILIDGFNPKDNRVYCVKEVIFHHYYVTWRNVGDSLDRGAKEFNSELQANKAWSDFLSHKMDLF